jgi:hypothetical protein
MRGPLARCEGRGSVPRAARAVAGAFGLGRPWLVPALALAVAVIGTGYAAHLLALARFYS